MNTRQKESVEYIEQWIDGDNDIFTNKDYSIIFRSEKNIYHVGIRGGRTLVGLFSNGKFYDNGSYTYR